MPIFGMSQGFANLEGEAVAIQRKMDALIEEHSRLNVRLCAVMREIKAQRGLFGRKGGDDDQDAA